MTLKKIVFVLLFVAPAGATAAEFVRITVKPELIKVFGSHKFVNRIVFLSGQNEFHDAFAVDFHGETTKPTGVVKVFTPTVHGKQHVDIEVPADATAVAVLTDGDTGDYKPINDLGRLPGRKTRRFWQAKRLDKLVKIAEKVAVETPEEVPAEAPEEKNMVYLFEVKESAAKDIQDKYLLELFNKLDEWIKTAVLEPEPEVAGAVKIEKIRVHNIQQTMHITHVVFSNHVVTQNNNGYPLPLGDQAKVDPDSFDVREVAVGKSMDFTVPEGATTVILLNVAKGRRDIVCLGTIALSEVDKKVEKVRGGWKVKYQKFLPGITITADIKGDSREDGFYDRAQMPWLDQLMQGLETS